MSEQVGRDELTALAGRFRRGLAQLWVVGAALLAFEILLVLAAALYVPPRTLENIQRAALPSLGDTNFSTLLVTGVTIAIGFIAGFLGLKRLEQFDRQIDSVRAEIGTQLRDDYARMGEEMRRFQEQMHDSLQRYERVVTQLAEAGVRDALNSEQQAVEIRWQQFVAETDRIVDRVNESLRPFAWLESRKDELDQLVGISTMEVAHDKITTFFREGKVDVAISIAEYAVRNRLPGFHVDYHNVCAELGRQGQYPLALQVVELGLERFPVDLDLRADAINCAIHSGDLTRAEHHYDALRSISFEEWRWRTFVFAGDLLENMGRTQEALELYEQFRRQLPDEERSYSQAAGILMSMGRFREAASLLEQALATCAKVGQCGMRLAECYMELGDYESAIRAASRAIESNAESQPSAAQASTVWYRATALDGLIHRKLQKGAWSADEIRTLAFQCVIDYITAISLPDSIEPFGRRGPERLRILRGLLIKHGIDTSFMEVYEDAAGELFAQIGKAYRLSAA